MATIYSKSGADAATAAAIDALNLGTAATADAGDFATAAQGALADATTVEQVTLNANLDYTLPAGVPANTIHRVVFTQNGTGGHTVTYDDGPVSVDLSAGASTTVELHPVGAGRVIRYPASGPTSGTNTGDQDLSEFAVKSANLSDLADAATARSNLGLGDSATKEVGTTEGTVKAGDWKPAADDVTDSTSAGRALVTGADAKAQRASMSAQRAHMIDVRDYGATGDGVTDDTAAIRAAIAAAGSTPVLVSGPGTYMVDAVSGVDGFGLRLTTAGSSLILDKSATLKVIPNSADGYQLIQVVAADCLITGGTLLGDVQTHAGTTGQWGHLIVVRAEGHRCTVSDITVREAWGDGIAIVEAAQDVLISDVIADSNRRQGLSIIAAVRPRVVGGIFRNTGRILAHSPSSGIDIEPNPGSGYDVTDALLEGVTCTNNVGPGLLMVRTAGQTTTATILGLHTSLNGTNGLWVSQSSGVGSSLALIASDVVSVSNGGVGMYVTSAGVTVNRLVAKANGTQGVASFAPITLTDINCTGNGKQGLEMSAGAAGSVVDGGVFSGNGQLTNATFQEVNIYDTCTLSNVLTNTPATAAIRASIGIYVRSQSRDTHLLNCRALGTPTNTRYSNLGVQTTATPHPSRRVEHGSAAPTVGVYAVGDRVEHTAPAPSGFSGWVCTTAGGSVSAAWAGTTAYTLGTWVSSGSVVYECTTAGTSGGTAPTPPGVGLTVVDGSVTWTQRATAIAAWKTAGAISA